MKKIFTLIFSCCLLNVQAQTLLYSQNFNTGSATDWSLNTSDLGGDVSMSDNVWTINNTYADLIGLGTNTPDEPSGIVGYPESYYLHIYSIVGATIYGLNDNFDAADLNSHFACLNTPLNTTGYNNVTFSFWWLCAGSAQACGKVYYRTSASGTWTQITSFLGSTGSTFYGSGSSWTKDSVHLTAFDGQPYLQFAFQFNDFIAGSDPAFGIDDIHVIGSTGGGTLPTVSFTPDPGTVCQDSCITFTNTSTSSGAPIDSVNWVVTGITLTNPHLNTETVCFTSPGVYTVKLYAHNTAGVDSNSITFTVLPAPNAGTITGISATCVGGTLTLSDATTGGTWSASNSHATVSAGIVTGVSAGTDIISYTVSNSCGTATATINVTVSSGANAGAVVASNTVCEGDSIALTDTISGGTWSMSNGHAAITSTTYALGVTHGVDTITYTVTSGSCGTAKATKVITVNPSPHPTITRTGHTLSTSSVYTSYQWLLGGSPISGATNSTYIFTANGTYQVIVDSGGCAAASVAHFYGLGIYDPSNADNFGVSQTINGINIISSEVLEYDLYINVYDITGRSLNHDVWTKGTSSKQLFWNSPISDGMYLIRLTNQYTSVVLRWIKK